MSNDDKVTELLAHKGPSTREMSESILSDQSLDILGALERSVEVALKGRAELRAKLWEKLGPSYAELRVQGEMAWLDDGVEGGCPALC